MNDQTSELLIVLTLVTLSALYLAFVLKQKFSKQKIHSNENNNKCSSQGKGCSSCPS